MSKQADILYDNYRKGIRFRDEVGPGPLQIEPTGNETPTVQVWFELQITDWRKAAAIVGKVAAVLEPLCSIGYGVVR